MPEVVEVASGLSFPEGPIAMPDGSVILVEMFGPRLTRVQPDGSKETIAEIPGGPNGAAVGPDGTLFLCNNGGRFTPIDLGGMVIPGPVTMSNYIGGRIQTVDSRSGAVADLYTECDGHPLIAPNDIVFDEHGGFYFTDHGLSDESQRIAHMTGILYAAADGSAIREVVFPANEPNGIGLSPMAASSTGPRRGPDASCSATSSRRARSPRRCSATRRCASRLSGNAAARLARRRHRRQRLRRNDGHRRRVVVSPTGELIDFVEAGDLLTTNICFGGDDLRTAYITASSTGRLLKTEWPRPGAKLQYVNR